MPEPLNLAVVGLGRIGSIHSQHAVELGAETGTCRLAAIVDLALDRARPIAEALASKQGSSVKVFPTVEALIAAGVSDACVVCTPTDLHGSHAAALVRARKRVIVEKSMTGSLAGDREFAKELDANYPSAVMLAYQGRFDEPLQHAKRLLDQGAVGRPFKIVAALEDSGPVPPGYISTSLFLGMSVHCLDDVLWLTGKLPTGVASLGSRVYGYKLGSGQEDFDDGLMCLWFPDDLVAQLTVSRNHVSGYRVEFWIFGEEGQIHVGRFERNKNEVVVEAYSRTKRIELKTYPMREYDRPVPEFVERFGHAYKRELAEFVRCCREGAPFPVTHRDGIRAMEVMASAARAVIAPQSA